MEDIAAYLLLRLRLTAAGGGILYGQFWPHEFPMTLNNIVCTLYIRYHTSTYEIRTIQKLGKEPRAPTLRSLPARDDDDTYAPHIARGRRAAT